MGAKILQYDEVARKSILDGVEYLIMREEDVLGIIEKK